MNTTRRVSRPHRLSVAASRDEYEWVLHAAKLRHMSAAEYIRRAINASLRREGVDAVLFRESADEQANV
jgi:hypothetical protein